MSVRLRELRFADPSLKFRIGDDLESRAAQHRFRGGAVRDPPVRLIACILLLDEIHAGEARLGEDLGVPEVVVVFRAVETLVAAQHCLEYQLMPYFRYHLVQRVQRIAKVIEDTHEEDEIELTGDPINVVDRTLLKFDVVAQRGSGEARLVEIAVVNVNAEHPAGTALFHLNGVEAPVAAHVEHGRSREISGYGVGD